MEDPKISQDRGHGEDDSHVSGNRPRGDVAQSKVSTQISKFKGDWTADEIDAGHAGKPYEELHSEDN